MIFPSLSLDINLLSSLILGAENRLDMVVLAASETLLELIS
jgi:hypothetical protein